MSLLLDDLSTNRLFNEDAAQLLHPSAPNAILTPEKLALVVEGLAKGLRFSCEQPRLVAKEGRYFERLVRTDALECWLIAWGPSTFLGLHDHGESNGAFNVMSGLLHEASTNVFTRSPLRNERIRTGDTRSFDSTHIHELWNPNRDTAVSVHAYSPPLSSMTFFDHEPNSYLQVVRTETQDEWPDGTA